MYKVIHFFTDLHDNDHPYNVGDIFPREGIKVTEGRLKELAGSENKQGTPLIALEEETDTVLDSGNDAEPVSGSTAAPVSQKKTSAAKSRTKKAPAKKTAAKAAAETSGK